MLDGYVMVAALICAGIAWFRERNTEDAEQYRLRNDDPEK